MDIVLKYFSEFTDEQISQFKLLEVLYKQWNKKINIISRKDIEGLYEKHVLHSLSIAAVFDFPAGCEIIDIGTGGGFPGIPLAIFFPDVKFHLIDSIAKKVRVVEEIARAIRLKNVTTQHMRAEDVKDKKFDFSVSRAVAPLNNLWRWSNPLLKKENVMVYGYEGTTVIKPGLICLKGGNLLKEINESGCHPEVIEISSLFQEEYFKEKYLLYVAV
ncbi:MAG: 16S rRNA (guanine(527)-N(7))-methyltransferase RsmG [Chitinophagaceae bacterium]|nr:16S rRNA (guanine(527)-N(7))-methyltransferase RsmG [Chitinophagaceae bacterium]